MENRLFSANEVLELMDIEDCDGESENLSFWSTLDDESDDGDRCHGNYIGEDGNKQLVDAEFLSPVSTSIFIASLGLLLPSG